MRVIALAVALVLGTGAGALASPDPAKIDAAREQALTSEYQAELPTAEAVDDGSGSGSGAGSARDPRGLGRGRRSGEQREIVIDTRDRRAEDTGPLGSLMTFLLWGVLIVMVALLAFWFAGEMMRGEDRAELAPDEKGPDADAVTAAIIARPLGDADELARRGEYAEAIHTLLLRTLEELVRSAAVRVERSHTSREILARVPLLADAREALSGLITAVELTHFGDEPANAADYERCRQQFHLFAAALRSSGLGVAPRSQAVPA